MGRLGNPCPPRLKATLLAGWEARPNLQAAVHHADDKVKLLVVQDCPVLLHMQV